MDHIVHLPPSNGFTAILVVVCRLTKQAHFIPARDDDDARTLAQQFLNHIFRLHGLPSDIVSDRGATFRSRWWKEFLSMLDIKPNLSTAFHPESDGQTERVNQIVQQHLRIYCDYLQDDWAKLLPLAEVSYNSTYHSAIGMTPFFANFGYHPRMSVTLRDSPVPDSEDRIRRIRDAHDFAKESMAKAQTRYSYYANRKRLASPEFAEGQRVWLLRRNIHTTRPSSKLDAKRLGPFRIERVIGKSAVELVLPASMRIHPVFHVSLIEKFHPNKLPSRQVDPPPDPIVDEEGEERWLVEYILDSEIRGAGRNRQLHYFVHWEGFDISERSWIPATELEPTLPKVINFHLRHPHKPGLERIEQHNNQQHNRTRGTRA